MCLIASLKGSPLVDQSVSSSVRLSHSEYQREHQLVKVEESPLLSNLIITQSFHHHEDASLATWALFIEIPDRAGEWLETSFSHW